MKIICDEAEKLWRKFLQSKDEKDRQKFNDHVRNCPEDFANLKYPWTQEAKDLEAKRRQEPEYNDAETREIENQLHEIGINCTSDIADCDFCDHGIECSMVFLKFDEQRKNQ